MAAFKQWVETLITMTKLFLCFVLFLFVCVCACTCDCCCVCHLSSVLISLWPQSVVILERTGRDAWCEVHVKVSDDVQQLVVCLMWWEVNCFMILLNLYVPCFTPSLSVINHFVLVITVVRLRINGSSLVKLQIKSAFCVLCVWLAVLWIWALTCWSWTATWPKMNRLWSLMIPTCRGPLASTPTSPTCPML